jgi:SAM-dependent methyltransferase
MSYFGADEMKNAGIDVQNVIYHTVDTEVFQPMDKLEQRAALGIQEDIDFLIGMVMANKGDRKQYPIQLEAIRLFMEKNPDLNVRVYIHTEPTNAMGGWDMRAVVDQLGLKGKVYSTNQYDTSVVAMPQDFMARLYNSFDVLMNCSSGEGFGIPIIEAQACGVPVIAHDVTAMSEITHNGYLVKTAAKGLGAHFSWQYLPDLEDMVYRLDCVYRMADKQRAEVGRSWVEANCSVPVIAQQWADLLTEVGDPGKALSGTSGPRFLNVGCGSNPLPGALNHDRIIHSNWVDFAHDLEVFPWPWEDEEWEFINADDVMEHLHVDLQVWMNEMWRILKPGGELSMRLPAWDNPLSYRDPTHYHVFHEESFAYWDPDDYLFKLYGRYYFAESNKWWTVKEVRREAGDLRFVLRKLAGDVRITDLPKGTIPSDNRPVSND